MGTRALLVYPEMPPTYWSMRYALPFLGCKAAFPPLGLLTVAAMLPSDWDIRILDMNVEPISQREILASDIVFASAMLVQQPSFERLVDLCREVKRPLVAGGPYPTSCHESIDGVAHFVLGEAEVNLPTFLEDFRNGHLKSCYRDPTHPDISRTPPPRFDLVDRNNYACASVQFSRGCPHHCEFCDIVELFGHAPRTKTCEQFLAELDLLFEGGWRGSLFIVDDNFIGNRAIVRRLLPSLIRWQEERRFPFSLYTEATLDLASDEALMEDMVRAGFNMVFVGIETPEQATLKAVGKEQNCRADLLTSIEMIQRKGLEVAGGFIVGFDDDRPDIFDRQIRFIQKAAIPTAMVGLLTALPRTRLYKRLASEGRILSTSKGGNNTHEVELNFVPKMDVQTLLKGYKQVLTEIYKPRRYFARCYDQIQRMRPGKHAIRQIRMVEVRAFVYSLWRQTFSSYVLDYWMYLLRSFLRRPRMTPEVVALAVKGHHFFTITNHLLEMERFRERLERCIHAFEERIAKTALSRPINLAPLEDFRSRLIDKARRRCMRMSPDLHEGASRLLDDFRLMTEQRLAAFLQSLDSIGSVSFSPSARR
jgi:radical SAM superfamily enzyme YgiQ (UPF0313 family)